MDRPIILGMILAAVTLLGGIMAKGSNPAVLIDPAALIIIFVGTIACILNAFTMKEIKRVPKLFKILFTEQKLYEPANIIQMIVDLAYQARRDGLLSLETQMAEIDDPFIKKGLQMIVDGQDEQFLRDYMETEIVMMEERHASGALVFTQAGTYAPTLGVLGAVIGLIGALGSLDDVDALGVSIAAAFVATLFGIFTGYVLWHPFANKLKRKSQEEIVIKTMILEGLISIQSGSNPVQIKEKMMVFLTPEQRQLMEEGSDIDG
ncbi:Flagellar motor rotation protein MotA [Candidatus Syntrophocurvum alkaliphilum]|uniref:Flagellar motor rotation protein MotA n=1 Tax=Candidatus Syntrophocurvum alkaliphilum TaxID=2293317 RepID=A0A6I6DHH2_9FIRM|nr:flagellar motor stator protein MotA [Candidatus Syntrophocurvum alkaliphilum]QGU00233.1 Flagellar motor rotation protein MotA [Candidatus Syntrophocurvum alkaliphilum]